MEVLPVIHEGAGRVNRVIWITNWNDKPRPLAEEQD